jgi:hypothetical protein
VVPGEASSRVEFAKSNEGIWTPTGFESRPGTYALLLSSPTDALIRVGRLGEMRCRDAGHVRAAGRIRVVGLRLRVAPVLFHGSSGVEKLQSKLERLWRKEPELCFSGRVLLNNRRMQDPARFFKQRAVACFHRRRKYPFCPKIGGMRWRTPAIYCSLSAHSQRRDNIRALSRSRDLKARLPRE